MQNKQETTAAYFLVYFALFIIFVLLWLIIMPFIYLLAHPEATWFSLSGKIFVFKILFSALENAAYLMIAVIIMKFFEGES